MSVSSSAICCVDIVHVGIVSSPEGWRCWGCVGVRVLPVYGPVRLLKRKPGERYLAHSLTTGCVCGLHPCKRGIAIDSQ